MRQSQLYVPTLKETPREAEVISHQLLLRAGYMRKLAAGIYSFLPLAWRTLRKIEEIVRDEMNRAGAQELLLPAVQPSEIWEESGRWEVYGPELLRFEDRKGGDFCLGPTHEEVIVDLVRGEVRSYRDLPLNLYQIQTKFRDEIRPRAGLLRGREFIMKDAYSFDTDEETAKASYQAMYDAYTRIFDRCGLRFRPVEADTGNIGGNLSHEFQVLADSGEDSIVSCEACGYTANVEKAEIRAPGEDEIASSDEELTKVETPDVRTVEEIAAFLDVPVERILKTVLYLADDKPVGVVMRGDHDVNEIKLKSALGATQLELAGDDVVRRVTGAPVGFAGPVGLEGVQLLADHWVRTVEAGVVGANEADAHLTGVAPERDLSGATFTDLRIAAGGDPCGRCDGTFAFFRGIEVGQVFFLGTKYSDAMSATFTSDDGDDHPFVMGCYGIGITRTMAAAIEQNHDDNGIIWPIGIAPFEVHVLCLSPDRADVLEAATRIVEGLEERGVEVLFDDRDERPGSKFKDADLIGLPLRVTVGGRGVANGTVEVKHRRERKAADVVIDDAVDEVVRRIDAERALEQPRTT